ncbi:hypothetical protein BJ165DRAFT_1448677 [Panaeolus papilionaceus]|nr:hypothetical protein BJ165DRAFT_1448677 [Panaeolus papilionaceus]
MRSVSMVQMLIRCFASRARRSLHHLSLYLSSSRVLVYASCTPLCTVHNAHCHHPDSSRSTRRLNTRRSIPTQPHDPTHVRSIRIGIKDAAESDSNTECQWNISASPASALPDNPCLPGAKKIKDTANGITIETKTPIGLVGTTVVRVRSGVNVYVSLEMRNSDASLCASDDN